MPPRKKPRGAESAGESSATGARSSTPQINPRAQHVNEGLGAANGYGMEDEEMGWASLGKPSWKGKGLSDEIKTVEVSNKKADSLSSSFPFRVQLTPCLLSRSRSPGQVASATSVPQGQGSRETASRIVRSRLVQLVALHLLRRTKLTFPPPSLYFLLQFVLDILSFHSMH